MQRLLKETLVQRPARHNRRFATFIAILLALLAASCGRDSGRQGVAANSKAGSPMELPVRVLADTGRSQALRVAPPHEVSVWVARVSPSRPRAVAMPPPTEAPDTLIASDLPPPPALEVDPDLKPPILRTPAALHLPSARARIPEMVELDVRVDEEGSVSDALWAGGSADSARVAAAIESALAMRFFPALKAGRPIAVWCRHRFDFGAGR
jgi:hypothetical protein